MIGFSKKVSCRFRDLQSHHFSTLFLVSIVTPDPGIVEPRMRVQKHTEGTRVLRGIDKMLIFELSVSYNAHVMKSVIRAVHIVHGRFVANTISLVERFDISNDG